MRLKILNCPGGGPFRSNTFYVLLINGVGFPGGSVVKNLPPNAGNEDLIPGLGRSPGEENSNPLQYSHLENPMVRDGEEKRNQKSHQGKTITRDKKIYWIVF